MGGHAVYQPGLPNRDLLNDHLEQAISRAAWRGYFLALVFIDLHNFKLTNDTLPEKEFADLLIASGGQL